MSISGGLVKTIIINGNTMKLLKRMRQWLFTLIWKDIQDVLRRENKFNTVCVAKKKMKEKKCLRMCVICMLVSWKDTQETNSGFSLGEGGNCRMWLEVVLSFHSDNLLCLIHFALCKSIIYYKQ